ncbi:MAG: prefoldin subunit alpha [Candidatus Pacearchaeota archaeon]
MEISKEYEEILFKLSMFEQHAKFIQQQLRTIEEDLIDLNSLYFGLDELKNSREKEILAQIGRGIFIRSKILSEDLIVNVGGKSLVKKNILETKKIIKKQIENLEEIKKNLESELEEISSEVKKIVS